MTRYRIASDIHCELWPDKANKARRLIDRWLPPLPEDPDTILLLAGDTGSHRRRNIYAAVVGHLCDRFKLVLDIPGNHFWYGDSDWEEAAAPTSRPNYHFGSMFTDGEVVAATLWTDFQRGNPMVEMACIEGMNDFKQIPGLTPDLVKQRHAEHMQFLTETIRPGCVVMTHFAPSWQCVPPHFKADIRNGYYASDIEGLILDKKPALWCHGHTHTACNYMVGGTRVVCNPARYGGEDHDPRQLIETV